MCLRVLPALAGIGPESSALCSAFIAECAGYVKDFIYVGTSGYSSQASPHHSSPANLSTTIFITVKLTFIRPPSRQLHSVIGRREPNGV